MGVAASWSTRLWFGPDDPVRAASAICALGEGWLVAQDDANHGAWWRPDLGTCERIRLLPPVDGRDVFGEASGTKHLKPDLEAACTVEVDGGTVAVVLGSGSLPARTRGVAVRAAAADVEVVAAELAPLYALVRGALGLRTAELNLEGACVVGDALRWFQRGHGASGVASASVDVDLRALLAALHGDADPARVDVGDVRRYPLGTLDGLALAVTDAVALPSGAIALSATAEDTPDAVADGPVAGSVLALVDEAGGAPTVLDLPADVATEKVEGLAVAGHAGGTTRLLAVVDADDPATGSLALELTLTSG